MTHSQIRHHAVSELRQEPEVQEVERLIKWLLNPDMKCHSCGWRGLRSETVKNGMMAPENRCPKCHGLAESV